MSGEALGLNSAFKLGSGPTRSRRAFSIVVEFLIFLARKGVAESADLMESNQGRYQELLRKYHSLETPVDFVGILHFLHLIQSYRQESDRGLECRWGLSEVCWLDQKASGSILQFLHSRYGSQDHRRI